MKIKINIKFVFLLLTCNLIFACNKSVIDFEDNLSIKIKEDTIINTNEFIKLSNKRPAVFRHYSSYYLDPDLYNTISVYFNPTTFNINYYTNNFNMVNFQVDKDSLLIIGAWDTTKLILNNRLVLFAIKGSDTMTKYIYNNDKYLTRVESTLSIDYYFYSHGNLIRLERETKPPFTEYSSVSSFEYYDSIFVNEQPNFVEFSHLNYFTLPVEGYSYLNLFGETSKNLLKSAKTKVAITGSKDSIYYKYKYIIVNKVVKELNVEQNDTIVQKAVFDSYYD